jgi:hypothetical protein
MLRGGQGYDGDGMYVLFLQFLHKVGIARVGKAIKNEKSLLRLPDPAGRGFADGMFRGGLGLVRVARLESMEAHGIVRGIVEDEREEIELQDNMEAFGEFVKEGLKVALLRNGLSDLKERLDLPARVIERRSGSGLVRKISGIRHEIENSIGLGRGQT